MLFSEIVQASDKLFLQFFRELEMIQAYSYRNAVCPQLYMKE